MTSGNKKEKYININSTEYPLMSVNNSEVKNAATARIAVESRNKKCVKSS